MGPELSVIFCTFALFLASQNGVHRMLCIKIHWSSSYFARRQFLDVRQFIQMDRLQNPHQCLLTLHACACANECWRTQHVFQSPDYPGILSKSMWNFKSETRGKASWWRIPVSSTSSPVSILRFHGTGNCSVPAKYEGFLVAFMPDFPSNDSITPKLQDCLMFLVISFHASSLGKEKLCAKPWIYELNIAASFFQMFSWTLRQHEPWTRIAT